MYLQADLNEYFSTSQSLFDQMMALNGDVFRHQDGRKTQRIQLGDKHYFIKQHFGVGWREIIKNIMQLRAPILSAKTEWLAIKKLQALSIPTPPLMAYGERGKNPATRQSFILMAELAPTISLEDLCATWKNTPPPFAFKQRIIEKVASIARLVHKNGINHRDFYICHFLLDIKKNLKNAENIKLYLIDLHRAQIRKKTPLRWIIKDLAGLYFSSKDIGLTRRDLFRFMKMYANKSMREIFNDDKSFWQKVNNRGEQLYIDHHQ